MIQVGDLVYGYFLPRLLGIVVQVGNPPVFWDEESALVAYADGSRAWEPLEGLRKV